MENKKKLRLYTVQDYIDAYYCEVVCAYSSKEAKQIAWDSSDYIKEGALDGEGWIGVKVKWVKGAYVEGLKLGILEPSADALRRESFSWIEEAECPICMSEGYLSVNEYQEEGKDKFRFVGCSDCSEKFEEDKLKKEDIPKEAIPYKDLIKNDQL